MAKPQAVAAVSKLLDEHVDAKLRAEITAGQVEYLAVNGFTSLKELSFLTERELPGPTFTRFCRRILLNTFGDLAGASQIGSKELE